MLGKESTIPFQHKIKQWNKTQDISNILLLTSFALFKYFNIEDDKNVKNELISY